MFQIYADQSEFRRVAEALEAEADGAELIADLSTEILGILEPAVSEAKSRILGSGGLPHDGPSIRSAIAERTGAKVSTRKNSLGVRVRVLTAGMPRAFALAGKRFNQRVFRRQAWGKAWVDQVGAPEWFDGPLLNDAAKYREAVLKAMRQAMDRVARKG